MVASAALHLAPGVVTWRQGRCVLLPRLAGVGALDHVALSFDDGPDQRSTPAILDVLDRLGWKATFFCLGTEARRWPALTRQLVERGHEIGVHGDRHVSHQRRPPTWTVPDLLRARDTLEELSGEKTKWFRPPYGALSASSLIASHQAGLRPVLWTTWGKDWRPGATGSEVAAEVDRTFWPGSTVLLHDSDVTSAPDSWRSTLAALPILAETWSRAGLRVGPLRDHGIGPSRWWDAHPPRGRRAVPGPAVLQTGPRSGCP